MKNRMKDIILGLLILTGLVMTSVSIGVIFTGIYRMIF